MGKDEERVQVAPAIRAQLTEYYLSAESELGMRSSFGVLVDAALGGWSSSSDHDRSVVRRHQLGPQASTGVTRAREVRTVLLTVGSAHEAVLDAMFGMHDWPHTVDHAFGKGMGIKVVKALGELAGVALLTEAVRRGYERDRERKAASVEVPATVYLRSGRIDAYRPGKAQERATNARPWDTPGGWLVAACLQKDQGDKRLDAVRSESATRARGALSAYGDAVGVDPFVTSEAKIRKTRERRPVGDIERVWPDGGTWSR